MEETSVDFPKIEQKWQKRWAESKTFESKEEKEKKKYYALEMYAYPSGSGLHMGHAFNYTIGDVFARFKRMQGFNVLHPVGYDSFGLPAENAAIKEKTHPKIYTEKSIKNFITQQKFLGLSYDWSRILWSHDPNYYKWNQWFFLKLYEKGLAYRKKSPVNWCPKCDTVLANEQVHNGKCWRHEDTDVEIKNLEQWFLKTTEYADELLREVNGLDWPDRIKTMQRNWIGRSEGTEISFEINSGKLNVFTTRLDTLFGVTFLVMSTQHNELMNFVSQTQKKDVEKFLKKIKSTKQEDVDKLEKDGVFSGSFAIHPLTKEKIPIWIGNFVVADYGSGVVMGVPAHDKRDFEFAKKYDIQIRVVIKPEEFKDKEFSPEEAYTGNGILTNSVQFNGLFSEEAKEHILKSLEKNRLGKNSINYKMRDWLVSRQRYWGTPIPIIYCWDCGIIPVSESDLPILLPEEVTFGKGNPLETNANFVDTTCPNCGKKAKRETDTMDTFFDSSWYYLRFCDSKNDKKPFDKEKTDYWMPVDFYTGGAEHACMHLIYARFFTKALRDMGLLNKDLNEPFRRLFNQGMVHGEDGFVMSKSRGNIVDPMIITEKYGADTLRIFLISMSSPDNDFSWNSTGIETVNRFLKRVYGYFSKAKFGNSNERTQSKLNKFIKEINLDIENLRYNLAVIKLRQVFDYICENECSQNDLEYFVKILSIFAPHLSEELWEKLGHNDFVSISDWPIVDEKKINANFEKEDKLVDEITNDINNVAKIVREKGGKFSKVYVYSIPGELKIYSENTKKISKSTNLDFIVFASNDRKKYDPQDKAKKAKPGKPAIFLG